MGRLRLWSIFSDVGEILKQRVGSTNVRINRVDQFVGPFHLPFVQLLEPGDCGAELVGDDAHVSVVKVLGGFLPHESIVAECPLKYYICYKTSQSPREGRAGLQFLRGRVGARELN